MLRFNSLKVWAVAAVLATAAQAQTNIEVNAGLQLNLSQPGARSLGMGGAFIGLADDATAAYTNPAGLANLSVGEVSLEARGWDYRTTYTDEGFGVFNGNSLDDSGLIEGEAESSTGGYSFGALTLPWKNWVFSLYSHKLADYEVSFETHGAEFGDRYLLLAQAHTSLEVDGTGFAAATRIGDSFSLGLGVISYKYAWDASVRRFRNRFTLGSDFWVNEQEVTAFGEENEDRVVAGSLGFEWKITERWRLGGVYRQGPEFEFSTSNTLGPDNSSQRVFASGTGIFKVPDVTGLGIAYKSTSFRVLFDWVHIKYSQLTENTANVFGSSEMSEAAAGLTLDDGHELHLGFEYVWANIKNPIAVRVGSWLDPDHRIRYEGPFNTSQQQGTALIFRPGDDELHYSAGAGVSFSDGRFELNVAADFSERIDTASASLVVRFF